jgi:hypothetical protein
VAGKGRLAELLAERGALREGMSVEEAGDVIWARSSLAVHDLLVVTRRWSSERYQVWLGAALAHELLPPSASAQL